MNTVNNNHNSEVVKVLIIVIYFSGTTERNRRYIPVRQATIELSVRHMLPTGKRNSG